MSACAHQTDHQWPRELGSESPAASRTINISEGASTLWQMITWPMNSEAPPLRKLRADGARVKAGGPECRAAPSQLASSGKAPHRARPDRSAPERNHQAHGTAIRHPEAEALRAPQRPPARPLAARAAKQAEPPRL